MSMQRPAGPPTAQPGGMKALGRSLRYLREGWWLQLVALVSLLVVLAASLVVPQGVRLAIDGGLRLAQPELGPDVAMIWQAVGLLVLAAAVRGLFSFLQEYTTERASQGLAYHLRDELFAKIQRLSFSYFDRVETGQLVTRLTNDVEQVRGFLGRGLLGLAQSVIMLVGSIGILLALNWRLTLAALLTVLPIFGLMGQMMRRAGPLFGRVQAALGKLNTLLQQDLQGLRIVRAYGREAHELERYEAANTEMLDLNLALVRIMSNTWPFTMFFASLGTLVVVGFGGHEVLHGRLTVGELLAFNSYLGFLLMPIMTLGFLGMGIARAGASALRLFEVLDAAQEVMDAPGAVALPPISGAVSFEGVSFRYPGAEADALVDLSFTLAPGETVAVLGGTGSGKSTLVALLPRFYDATRGTVRLDGHDVRQVTLASLRGQLGIVMQEALLFSGTVRENLAYGRPEATEEEIVAAARAAQAEGFISELPQGYDTVVGEKGVGLSGGQRQRIAIARALLLEPRLLILDDSTSAVDAETEAAIELARDRLLRDRARTAVIIAQRLSTVKHADRVLVLDKGRLAAEGTHDELLLTSELYREILGSQLEPELQMVGGEA